MRRQFRYALDPLFLSCVAIYFCNRFLLKPHLPWSFLHDHLNDLICIPFWVPVMLSAQRGLGLRKDDDIPHGSEILIPLLIWSWAFEVWLPATNFAYAWETADPLDVIYYSLGALGAAIFWRWWYGRPNRTAGLGEASGIFDEA